MAHVKEQFPTIIDAAHTALKRSRGGISAVATILGRNEKSMANAFNPMDLSAAPTLQVFLETLFFTKDKSTLRAIAHEAGYKILIEEGEEDTSQATHKDFISLVHNLSAAMTNGSEVFSDGIVTESEKKALKDDLDNVIDMAQRMRNKLGA